MPCGEYSAQKCSLASYLCPVFREIFWGFTELSSKNWCIWPYFHGKGSAPIQFVDVNHEWFRDFSSKKGRIIFALFSRHMYDILKTVIHTFSSTFRSESSCLSRMIIFSVSGAFESRENSNDPLDMLLNRSSLSSTGSGPAYYEHNFVTKTNRQYT